jgi:hypothetical protein
MARWFPHEVYERRLRAARLFRYRSKHGAEVDFVLEVGRELWAIEVKATRMPAPAML